MKTTSKLHLTTSKSNLNPSIASLPLDEDLADTSVTPPSPSVELLSFSGISDTPLLSVGLFGSYDVCDTEDDVSDASSVLSVTLEYRG